ncbi:hypothetical protein [Streptomyces brevispora]|uniref:hypothetical protein n=1 Tax=Streptomyces brevispora TaxID=887462 RepID=UPI0037F5E8AE
MAIIPAAPHSAGISPDLTTIPLHDVEPGHVVVATRAADRGRPVTPFRTSARACLNGEGLLRRP